MTTAAHAEMEAEVSAGGGAETGAVGYAVVRAGLTAENTREAPPVIERLFAHCPTDENGCMWVFSGLERDQIDGVGASVEASMRASLDGDLAEGLALGGEAWATGAGWRIGVRADVQPEGRLRDRFWRSGRGIVQRNIRLDVPLLWAIGDARTQIVVMPGHVDLGARTAYDGAELHKAGFDRDFTLLGFGIRTQRVRVDVLEFRYLEYGVETEQYQGTTYGTSAEVIEVDVARASVQVTPSFAVSARGGIAAHLPVAPFVREGGSETSRGPSSFVPTFWLEARRAAGASTFALGGGSWTRLDPSGHAVDNGGLGTASASWIGAKLRLRGEAQLGHLRRILVGSQAPAEIARVGTRAWMGRASLEASVALRPSLGLGATAWLERSDRDDPRWISPSTGLVANRAGAHVEAVWRFERTR